MATVSGSKVRLNNGQLVTPQQGGWYDGQQFWGNSLGGVNVINNPNQQGYGQQVSNEVVKQTNPANVQYIQQRQQQQPAPQAPVVPYGNTGVQPGGAMPGNGAVPGGTGVIQQQQPSLDLQTLYSQFQSDPTILAADDKANKKMAEIEMKRRELAEAEATINDNPFFSEATRVGRIAKLREKADAEFKNLDAEYQNLSGAGNKLRADAETKLNLAMKQYDINRQDYQDSLSRFNMLLQAGALNNAGADDLAMIAKQTGISTGMLESIIQKTKQESIKPQLISSTDDNGNVTVSVFDVNTGQLINQTSLGSIGNKEKGSGGGSGTMKTTDLIASFAPAMKQAANSYGHVDPANWKAALSSWQSRGGTRDEFVANFKQYTDPNRSDFETAYGFDIALRSK